jgi:hypothetical protein
MATQWDLCVIPLLGQLPCPWVEHFVLMRVPLGPSFTVQRWDCGLVLPLAHLAFHFSLMRPLGSLFTQPLGECIGFDLSLLIKEAERAGAISDSAGEKKSLTCTGHHVNFTCSFLWFDVWDKDVEIRTTHQPLWGIKSFPEEIILKTLWLLSFTHWTDEKTECQSWMCLGAGATDEFEFC